MLQEAHNRISAHPDKYVDHIYGEKEAGGTSVLYLSSVPFEKIGFPDVGTKPYPAFSKMALHAVPPAVIGCRRIARRRLCLPETKGIRAGDGVVRGSLALRTTAITWSSSPFTHQAVDAVQLDASGAHGVRRPFR